MSFKPAISVSNVTKHYLIYDNPEDRLKQMIVPRFQRFLRRPIKQFYTDFPAVKNVSFDVKQGQTVGIIGRNGSGKSTLLQMICRILTPTNGKIKVNGRIAALLELGAGFNPEYTGRENVFLNASILGLSRKEIEDRFAEIERFANIGVFIDQPVKTYSSGMFVRLAFAVATSVDPDILIVDEALAVGDEAFQRKCFARIEQIKERGGTILFVSHGAQTIIELCDRAILLDAGEILLDGLPKVVVAQYQRLINASESVQREIIEEIKTQDFDYIQRIDNSQKNTQSVEVGEIKDESFYDPEYIPTTTIYFDSKGAKIYDVKILSSTGKQVNILTQGQNYFIEYKVDFDRPFQKVGFGGLVKSVIGGEIGGFGTSLVDQLIDVDKDNLRLCVKLEWSCILQPGAYFINVGTGQLLRGQETVFHKIIDAICFKVISDKKTMFSGHVDLGFRCVVSRNDNSK